MVSTRHGIVAAVAFATMSGCISNPVAKGALIGAVSGAALGAGTGVLISDEHLLGSTRKSLLPLGKGESIGVGTLIGASFGALIGSMIGHQHDTVKPEKA